MNVFNKIKLIWDYYLYGMQYVVIKHIFYKKIINIFIYNHFTF